MKYHHEIEEYFEKLNKEIKEVYDIASKARAKGLDPEDHVEAPLALTMAAKVVKLIATKYPQVDNEEIVKRILELEEEHGGLDPAVSFRIAEEIAQEKFCRFENKIEAMDAGIRVGFAYNTLGVVSSPIEGFTKLSVGKRKDGKEYIKAYFSGPIRSAGTTASCLVLILIDYLRQLFGFSKYDPTEEECKRTVTELYDYHERVTNLQYLPTEEEAYFIAKNLPIQVCGDPTENKEVSNFKDLERVDTNFIRGGFCLILGEGLAQKAPKGLRILKNLQKKGFKIKDWEWLEAYVQLHEKREKGKGDSSPTYIKDLVAGRPVLGHPGRGFRFRYGRSRTSGFSAASIHPATMVLTNDLIAVGTQLKLEKPMKGCVVTVCDGIEGPIVKLKNGSVKKVHSYEEAKVLSKEVEEIIYLGDLLVSFGDVINRNSVLLKPGYVEEWWSLDLKKSGGNIKDPFNVNFEEAIELSEKFNIPLHPKFIFYWTQIGKEDFIRFLEWINEAKIREGKILFPFGSYEKEKFSKAKRVLELLGVEHSIGVENVIVANEEAKALCVNLGIEMKEGGIKINLDLQKLDNELFNRDSEKEGIAVLEVVNKLSKFEIKDKAGEFVGARMGRPEKAKLRKLVGSPNILFPVGEEGGRLRSVNEALNVGKVKSTFPFYFCEKCKKETIYRVCEECGERTKKRYFCNLCKTEVKGKVCKLHNRPADSFKELELDINHYFEKARFLLGLEKLQVPELIKGVRGTSSNDHDVENLVKGILRAKYNLQVNKDGTIRYDATEMPVTYFKPKEIEVGVDKLRELGYKKDYLGNELVSEEQILELKPHDIIIPCNNVSGDERADEVFIRVANFIDELLEKFYGLKRYYNVKSREDLVGKLAVTMAPHNCAGVICRIIGFSKLQGLLGSPYLHAAMRRDCDGDEASISLLLDVLLNFSIKFLPGHRGGTQDAPLVLNGRISPKEVDDQILDFDLAFEYPLELYEKAEQGLHSGEVEEVETVKDRILNKTDPFVRMGFTHNSEDFNKGVVCSSYKTLPSMKEKVETQMDLCVKLRSVDEGDVARLIIDRHFMRDLKGNLRKFSEQNFRCSTCNAIYRRIPLVGKCNSCGGRLIFTISYGSIIKYLESALDLAKRYTVPEYIKQDLELTKKYIESVFGKEEEKQEVLAKWF